MELCLSFSSYFYVYMNPFHIFASKKIFTPQSTCSKMLQKQIHQISEQDRLLSDLDLNVSLKISSAFHRLLLLSENSDSFFVFIIFRA